jgi:hypothetical protein
MRIEASEPEATEERRVTDTDASDAGSSDEEGDPADPGPLSARVAPCTVWFGPKGSASFEREMLRYLGSHNGVAVLQWPRDSERSARCNALGIPTLCLVTNSTEPVRPPQGLQEWLPSNATDQAIHDCLGRLSEHGSSRRAASALALDSEGLHLGDGEVHLDGAARELAAVLIASFEQAVDDDSLSCVSGANAASRQSLVSELLHLDREVNQLGLEVVPLKEHAHLMRRCGR